VVPQAQTSRTWSLGEYDPQAGTARYLADTARRGRLVESIVVNHLLRRYKDVVFWRNSGEIDAVCRRPDGGILGVEVKYQSGVTSGDKAHLRRLGGGIVVTRDRLQFDEATDIVLLPAPIALVLMG